MEGAIHGFLKGKRIAAVVHDDERLTIVTTCGHWVRIVWRDEGPDLEGIDVKVLVAGVEAKSSVGALR